MKHFFRKLADRVFRRDKLARRAGFTLAEMITVVAVVGTLAGATYTQIQRGAGTPPLTG